jgi:hypothetical protein
MGANLVEEKEKRPVQSVFRKKSQLSRYFALMAFRVRTQRNLQIVLIVVVALLVLVVGYAIGGGFSSSSEDAPAEPTAAGDYFITAEQANVLRAQSIDLQEAQSRLAITEGEAAFLRSQNLSLSDHVETLQRSFNRVQVEMGIIVGIYEECMDRLYPAECVATARPQADAFLAELYAEGP